MARMLPSLAAAVEGRGVAGLREVSKLNRWRPIVEWFTSQQSAAPQGSSTSSHRAEEAPAEPEPSVPSVAKCLTQQQIDKLLERIEDLEKIIEKLQAENL